MGGSTTAAQAQSAALLAAMHHGITGKLDPGPPVTGNGYEAAADPSAEAMPSNWFSAVDRFAGSAMMKEYLGGRFVDIYSIVKRQEQDRYFGEVPALDYEWYLRTA